MKKDNLRNPPNLKRIDTLRLKEKTNKLVKCGTLVFTQLLGIKEIKNKKKEEPFWKRKIESNINDRC